MNQFLNVDHISCSYEDQLIVKQLSFTIEQGEIACLLGPSGSGKTTVLRTIAGFHPIQTGEIVLDGRTISNAKSMIVPEQRHISLVFQDYALFPHLNVWENIAFGLRKLSRKEKQLIVTEMLELVRLPHLESRYPHELSGGQQQRVALARSLATQPLLLLMDEPFSNLDSGFRRELYMDVRDILKERQITTLVVTHDKEEAFSVADNIGILADGKLQQWDTPTLLFNNPANKMVANFMGTGQFIAGYVEQPNQIRTEIGLIQLHNAIGVFSIGDSVEIFIRPDEICHCRNHSLVQGEIIRKQFMGSSILHTFKLPSGLTIESLCKGPNDLEIGDKTGLQLETHNLLLFKQEGTSTIPIQSPCSIEAMDTEKAQDAWPEQ